MTGMAVAIASTCYWETDPPTFVDLPPDSPWSGPLNDLRGAIFVGRRPGENEYFEAQLLRDSLLSHASKPEILYEGPAIGEAVRSLNERLDALEREGYVKSPANDLPTRLDAAEVAAHADGARSMIADHLNRLPPEPPTARTAYRQKPLPPEPPTARTPPITPGEGSWGAKQGDKVRVEDGFAKVRSS